KLIGPTQDLSLRKRRVALGLHFRKVFAGDVLHHQKLAVTFVEMIADARQCLMMKPRQQARLALELLTQFLVIKQSFLERDRRIEALVHGLVNRAHPALTKLPNDAVATL